ncbi:hypothetical protein HO173_002306 [Letharia columbiana]|uniref:TauD/TfdA-like domain-containing protein n=1 Tax=Letharia columbiana TaxID=112416 RepID=A0A8H6G3D3_9LECA|nr:uncharacterized protein HO173_002306 [Letharia columbiana]KAF6239760.1 hypothetical protein HO173_002306 [Letharia columbiana]
MATVGYLTHANRVPTEAPGALSYYPTTGDALRFWSLREDKNVHSDVPQGFPAHIDARMAWQGSDMEMQSDAWVVLLSEADVFALEGAMRDFRNQALHLSQIDQISFRLPDQLAKRLDDISEECYNGRGFCVIRGLEPAKYTDEENVILYAGISAYIAPERGFLDRARQHVLCHVLPAAFSAEQDRKITPGFTNDAMSFHTDDGDILALYAMNTDQSGGRTQIASGWKVYNELASSRADVLHTLTQDWVLDTYQDYSQWPPIKTPLLFTDGEKVMFNFSRYPLCGFRGNKRNQSLPAPTESQLEALDAVHFFAEKNSMSLPTKTGDILYLNNMSMLHAREPFEDQGTQGMGSRRHMLKMQLRDPKRTWRLPNNLVESWKFLFAPNREDGGKDERFMITPEEGHERGWSSNG